MHNIKHRPIFDTKIVEDHYTEKDGVENRYVCTTAPYKDLARAVDLFYRETPHPLFGNKYFGLYRSATDGSVRIIDADNVENLVFSMLEYDGELHYSQHRHDYNVIADGVAIDGGRAYDRYTLVDATIKRFVIRDGKFEEKKDV